MDELYFVNRRCKFNIMLVLTVIMVHCIYDLQGLKILKKYVNRCKMNRF